MQKTAFIIIVSIFIANAAELATVSYSPIIDTNFKTVSYATAIPPVTSTVTYKSWLDSVGDSFTSVLIGMVIIFVSIGVLWVNERRYVKEAQIIISGKKICIEASPSSINPNYGNELVHLTGNAWNSEPLQDLEFDVVANNAAKLKRVIEVYQMNETSSSSTKRDSFGGGQTTVTEYHYNSIWSKTFIESSSFHDFTYRNSNENVIFITTNETNSAKVVKLGKFFLSPNQIEQLNRFESVAIPQSTLQNMPKIINSTVNTLWANKSPVIEGPYIRLRQKSGVDNIGDIRISFEAVLCGPTTLVAQQSGETFVPYDIKNRGFKRQTKNSTGGSGEFINGDERGWTCDIFDTILDKICCCCCCSCLRGLIKEDEYIDWVYETAYNKNDTFSAKESQNKTTTNLIRLFGWIFLILGFFLLFSPIIQFFYVIAIFGKAIEFAAFIISLIIATAIASIIIALSWLAHRPWISLLLLLISGVIVGLIVLHTNSAQEAATVVSN